MAGAALVLLLPPVLLGIGSGARPRRVSATGPLDDRVILLLVVAVIAAVLTNLGTIVYAGVLDELVGSVIRERPPALDRRGGARPADLAPDRGRPGGDRARSGSRRRSACVPGFVLLAMLGIVGPVVNIERARPLPRRSGGRSASPARHLWLTRARDRPAARCSRSARTTGCCTCATRPTSSRRSRVSVPLILTVGAFVGLTEVELAYALLARDERSPVAQSSPRRLRRRRLAASAGASRARPA